LPYLDVIAANIDFPAVALGWCSSGVIEIHQAQELLRFNGDSSDKSLKVLDVFNQLRRQENRIPLFLRELLKSGESSPTNHDLYCTLSQELDFSDDEVENACDRRWNGTAKKLVIKSAAALSCTTYITLSIQTGLMISVAAWPLDVISVGPLYSVVSCRSAVLAG